MTHTLTYTRLTPANPYLVCSQCGEHVCFWPQFPPEAEEHPHINMPCEHRSDYDNLCPSWSPVDGCRCLEHLGSVTHPSAADCDA